MPSLLSSQNRPPLLIPNKCSSEMNLELHLSESRLTMPAPAGLARPFYHLNLLLGGTVTRTTNVIILLNIFTGIPRTPRTKHCFVIQFLTVKIILSLLAQKVVFEYLWPIITIHPSHPSIPYHPFNAHIALAWDGLSLLINLSRPKLT